MSDVVEVYAGPVTVQRDGSTEQVRVYVQDGTILVWDGDWQVPGRYRLAPHLPSSYFCVCGLAFSLRSVWDAHLDRCTVHSLHQQEARLLSLMGDKVRPMTYHPDWSSLRAEGFRWPW